MIAPSIAISLLVGIALGQRFKVFVLALVVVLALLLALVVGVLRAEVGNIALVTVASIVSLQIGYFFGIGIRHLMVVVRYNRLHSNSLAHSPSSRRVGH